MENVKLNDNDISVNKFIDQFNEIVEEKIKENNEKYKNEYLSYENLGGGWILERIIGDLVLALE